MSGRKSVDWNRRAFLVAASAVPLVACSKHEDDAHVTSVASLGPADPSVVRVASVPTAVEGNLLPTLVADFEKARGKKVELVASEQPYELAREGKIDLAVSHYGHKHTEDFVMAGFGEWPRTIFSNQMALVGPPSDPAKIRGLTDVVEAWKRIAATKSAFLANGIDGVRYLIEIVWNAAGRPERGAWFLDEGLQKDAAILAASERGAYAFWGLTPFLRLAEKTQLKLEPLVLGDPLLQRMLVSVVVKPRDAIAVNADGARALEAYLLEPATQAKILTVRYPGSVPVTWVPGGRHNRTAVLPKG